MKKLKFEKKLTLKKETVTTLNNAQQKSVKGGLSHKCLTSLDGAYSCDNTCGVPNACYTGDGYTCINTN